MHSLDLDARLSASEAAAAVGVTKQVFNYWRRTGRIEAVEPGLYRYGDVLEVERDMRHSPFSRRRQLVAA